MNAPSPITNRLAQSDAFQHLLDDPERWIMPLSGLSGIGKTFLADHLIKARCSALGIAYASFNLASGWLRTDYLRILEELERQLLPSLAAEHWASYHQVRANSEHRREAVRLHFTQRIEARQGGSVCDVQQHFYLGDALVDALRQEEWRIRDDITAAFIRCLASDLRPLAVFLDGWEAVVASPDQELAGWLLDGLFWGLHAARPGLRLVIASREPFEHANLQPAILPCAELSEFSFDDTVDFLSRRGIANPEVQRLVFDWVHGHPLLTEMLTDEGEASLVQALPAGGRQAGTTGQAIAKWVRDRIRAGLPAQDRELMTYGVVLRRFDLDTLRALFPAIPPLDLDAFSHFVSYSFVKRIDDEDAGWAFYDLVRLGQLVELRQASERTYRDYHARAATYYAGLLAEERRVPLRHRYLLEQLYHRFAADEAEAIRQWWAEMRGAERHWEREWWRLLLELPAARELEIGEVARAWMQLGWGRYFKQGAQWQKAQAYLEDALAQMGRLGEVQGQVEATSELGDLAFLRGQDWDQAAAHLEAGLRLWERIGDPAGIVRCCNRLGALAVARSQWQLAHDYLERSQALAVAQGDLEAQARAQLALGDIEFLQGHWDAALPAYQASLDLHEQAGAVDGIVESTNSLGLLHKAQGQWLQALEHFDRSRRLCQELGNELRLGETLLATGRVYEAQGRWSRALEYYNQAQEIAQRIGDLVGEAAALFFSGEVNEVLGDLGAARIAFERAWQQGQQLAMRGLMAEAAHGLACVAMKQERYQDAEQLFATSRGLYQEIDNPQGMAVCYNNMAVLCYSQGTLDQAAEFFRSSLCIKQSLGDIPGQIATLQNLVALFERQGDRHAAGDEARNLVQLERQIGHPALTEDLLRLQALIGEAAGDTQAVPTAAI
jgi:tetratricopeptide (TPR) repeat protein